MVIDLIFIIRIFFGILIEWCLFSCPGNHSTPQRIAASVPNNQRTSSGDNYDESDELDPFFDPAAARLDGLFNGNPPVLAHTLLEAEQVPSAIAKLSASHLQLSRATQRLLREVVGSMENIKLRQKWQQMNRSSSDAQAAEEAKSAHSSGKKECLQHLLTQIKF